MLPRGVPQRSLGLPEGLPSKRKPLRKQALPTQSLVMRKRLSEQALRHLHPKVGQDYVSSVLESGLAALCVASTAADCMLESSYMSICRGTVADLHDSICFPPCPHICICGLTSHRCICT